MEFICKILENVSLVIYRYEFVSTLTKIVFLLG